MSLLYGENIKTHYIDPVFNRSKTRVEFRMPVENGLYLSNARIMNIGVVVDEPILSPRKYNLSIGSLSCIKSLFLYDGKVVLDQILNFPAVQAFRVLNRSNSQNTDSKKILQNHGIGYIVKYEGFDQATDGPFPDLHIIDEFDNFNRHSFPSASEETTPKGYLSLQDVFPLLKNVKYLDGATFKNLRIVMELQVKKNVLATVINETQDVEDTTQPLLAVDEVLNTALHSKVTSEFQSVVWNAIEQESVFLPESIGGPGNRKQRSVFILKGYDNKTVNSVFVQKEGLEYTSNFYGSLGSEEMWNEKSQFVLNGSNILPEDGITTPNQKLALMTSSFGNMNVIMGAQSNALLAQDNLIAFPQQRVGHHSYIGLMLNSARVQELQMVFERDLTDDDDEPLQPYYQQNLRLNVFAQVLKSIVKTKNGYQVVYV